MPGNFLLPAALLVEQPGDLLIASNAPTAKSADGGAGGRGKKKQKPSVQNAPEVNGQEEDNGRARQAAARFHRVAEPSVQYAKAILTRAPDIADEVLNCSLPKFRHGAKATLSAPEKAYNPYKPHT